MKKAKTIAVWTFWIGLVGAVLVIAVFAAQVMRDGTFDPMTETTHHGR